MSVFVNDPHEALMERDEARKAARALKHAVQQLCFFERHEILDAAEEHWPWLMETACDKCGTPVPIDRDECPEGIVWCAACASKEMEASDG